MALVNVQHKPVTGTARQFDGTLAAFSEILAARPLAGVRASVEFHSTTGALNRVTIDGGAFGNVVLNVNDWIVFPADGSPPLSIPAAQATAEWQVV